MAEPFYQFEVEHIFAQALFDNNAARAAILRQHGYTKEMASNKIALFKDADVVAQIENAPNSHPLRQLLRASGWGPVRHDGNANGDGGKQQGKNKFQKFRGHITN